MQQKLSNAYDGFSLLVRMFRLGLWAVTQAPCLSRQIGTRMRRLGSLRDNSGWKPKLLRG